MSQPLPAAERFVPFEPAVQPGATAATPPQLKVLRAAAEQEFNPLNPKTPGPPLHKSHHGPGSAPLITLQREGDRVVGIRVECMCGQVIELACSY